MKFTYRPYHLGRQTIYRPIVPVTVNGVDFDVLLDSGADVTWIPTDFPLPVSIEAILPIGGVAIPAAFLVASFRIQNDGVIYSWDNQVLFSNADIKPVLGHIGFFQFFKVIFDGESNEVDFTPTAHFPGKVERLWDE